MQLQMKNIKKNDFEHLVKKENQIVTKGIEVGHIFYFSDKYSKPMNCLIDDRNGKKVFCENGVLWNWSFKIGRGYYRSKV